MASRELERADVSQGVTIDRRPEDRHGGEQLRDADQAAPNAWQQIGSPPAPGVCTLVGTHRGEDVGRRVGRRVPAHDVGEVDGAYPRGRVATPRTRRKMVSSAASATPASLPSVRADTAPCHRSHGATAASVTSLRRCGSSTP